MSDKEMSEENRPRETGFSDLSHETYLQLKKVANARLKSQRPGMTLNCTALVHEAFLKLQDSQSSDPKSEDHYMAIASMAMRQILVDYARNRNAAKRGSGALHITLQESLLSDERESIDLLELDTALTKLAQHDSGLEKIIALRFFGGLNMEQIAQALNTSKRTVERDWTRARVYLFMELQSPNE